MRNFIHRLRAKPEHVRERIAWGSSAVFAFVLMGVWVSTSLMTTGILAPTTPPSVSGASSLATQAGQNAQKYTQAGTNSFLGSAVSAFTPPHSSITPNSKPHLKIVTVGESSTVPPADRATTTPEHTVIPF